MCFFSKQRYDTDGRGKREEEETAWAHLYETTWVQGHSKCRPQTSPFRVIAHRCRQRETESHEEVYKRRLSRGKDSERGLRARLQMYIPFCMKSLWTSKEWHRGRQVLFQRGELRSRAVRAQDMLSHQAVSSPPTAVIQVVKETRRRDRKPDHLWALSHVWDSRV